MVGLRLVAFQDARAGSNGQAARGSARRSSSPAAAKLERELAATRMQLETAARDVDALTDESAVHLRHGVYAIVAA